ncbi:type IV pilus biogenesis/stability protein PilW [Thiobacillus denitrificans]|uniref:Pilus assembly protein PilW n=1 Tax=Thiobacillus denitrificans TaxID=36861 RepID=A0A106BVK9_THIDE|nr:type IV pilus biogenesis/stability protein PilW [Thiobacillus denitrificans]KVW99459.1 pilus assembly protein PilW [Thiobacillus denitrificans]
MKKWIGILAAAMLAGCAVQPMDSGSGVANTQVDSESRQRARAFTDLAGAYFARAQYKVALDELRKAIIADNRFGPAYNIYGLIYMELAEDKLAEENFRRAIELDRSDSEARTNFGWFLCTLGRYDEGLEQFSTALRNPLYAHPEQAMANAGLCAEKKGDLALAEANLLKSLKLQPDNPNTVLKLAGLHFRQDRLMETQRLLGRHAELAPPTAESLWLGVRLERKLGDRAQEAAYGLQLRKRFPDSNEARLLLTGQYE